MDSVDKIGIDASASRYRICCCAKPMIGRARASGDDSNDICVG